MISSLTLCGYRLQMFVLLNDLYLKIYKFMSFVNSATYSAATRLSACEGFTVQTQCLASREIAPLCK